MQNIVSLKYMYTADAGGLQQPDCRDYGFNSRWGSLVFVVCCVGSRLCDELITRSEETYRPCLCVCGLETYRKETA